MSEKMARVEGMQGTTKGAAKASGLVGPAAGKAPGARGVKSGLWLL